MKFVTPEVLEGHSKATQRGALEGTLGGLALSVPASYYLHRRWAAYRALPVTIKVLGCILVVGPAFAIQAERRGVQYDMAQWTGAGKEEIEREKAEAEFRWDQLSTSQRLGDWASRHRYQLFLGCWVGSMAGSWLILRRNTTQTFSQKIVQARVYAQGITLASLLGGVALLHARQNQTKVHDNVAEHSWARMLEESEAAAHKAGHPVSP